MSKFTCKKNKVDQEAINIVLEKDKIYELVHLDSKNYGKYVFQYTTNEGSMFFTPADMEEYFYTSVDSTIKKENKIKTVDKILNFFSGKKNKLAEVLAENVSKKEVDTEINRKQENQSPTN